MTESRLAHVDAIGLFRAAARELMPVVVDMGPNQARFASFVGSVSGEGGGRVLLDPVAADALPTDGNRPFKIVAADGRASWAVTATAIVRESATRAWVDLANACVLNGDSTDGAVAVQVTDLLVLVVPGGLNGGAAYVFPIQRIGADVCEIRSSVALEPGQQLEQVEIIGDRRLLRRASAQVLTTSPWHMADGSRSFSCRLSLGDEVAADANSPHDLVTEPKEVRRLLEIASMLRAQGWYEAPGWGRGTLRFMEVDKDSARLELSTERASRPVGHRSVRIGVDLFAISYELDVRTLEFDAGQLRTSLPLILRRRRRHRREHRVPVAAPNRVELSFRHPVTGAVHTHSVSEVSFFALCFDCEPHASVLWQGLPLEQAQLTWGNRLVHLGDLTVEQYGYDQSASVTRCVASIAQSSVADDPDMICLLATLAHPRVRVHDGDFTSMHDMYLKAGLFGPHMHRNLAPIVEQINGVWRKLHVEEADIARTFVHGPEASPDAAVTIVRAWEHTWVPQHFVDVSPQINGATGSLQTAYLDHLVPRRDGRYLVFFVKTDNRVMNAYLKSFFASTGTPDAVTRSTVELWSRSPEGDIQGAPTRGAQLRPCQPSDETIVARAVERRLGPYAASALSMVPGDLSLSDTSRRFARAGLQRDRDCQMVSCGDEPKYAVIEERATPGINLTWMLNATWIIPIHQENGADGSALDAALASIVERPAQTPTGERFLNLPEGLDAERLGSWGFVQEAKVYLYVLTRAGLHRFLNYAVSRYGETDALVARRERRRTRES